MKVMVRVKWRDSGGDPPRASIEEEDGWQQYTGFFERVPVAGELVYKGRHVYKILFVLHVPIENSANYQAMIAMDRL